MRPAGEVNIKARAGQRGGQHIAQKTGGRARSPNSPAAQPRDGWRGPNRDGFPADARPPPARSAAARPAWTQNRSRQLAIRSSQPPNRGANRGDTDSTSSIWAKMRAASPGGKISRTQARARTDPAQPPVAWTKRAASRLMGPGASAQTADAQHIEPQSRQQRAASARSDRRGARPWPGPKATPQKIGGQRMFDRGDGGMEFARDGGQRRQIHVDGDGREYGQHPEQKDQFEAARGSSRGQGRIHRNRLEGRLCYKQVDARSLAPLTCRPSWPNHGKSGLSRPSNG